MKSLDWFKSHIGQVIFRSGHGDIVERDVTESNVNYLFNLQNEGFTYYVAEPAGSQVRVHSGPPESKCISCEG